jgi:hypothetical protein
LSNTNESVTVAKIQKTCNLNEVWIAIAASFIAEEAWINVAAGARP